MAPLLEDPRIRQTWNQISQNAGEATESAAAGIWTFGHKYITPCFASTAESCKQCTAPCFPDREERARRARERGRTRGRAELSFDFYDDWDEEDRARGGGGLFGGWGNDELDRLLAGSGSHSGVEAVDQAPRRKRGMSYGTRGRRKSLDPDPTVIPSTSALGFLGRLPFKFGGTLRYKPSAADLQEHPGTMRATEFAGEEGEPLISDEHSDDEGSNGKGHNRTRSSTTSSGATSDSFRSRGDLFPSDGEDDAVPLPDEFAMVLERRSTNTADDKSSGKSGKARSSKGKRIAGSRNISSRNLSRTRVSSQSRPAMGGHRASSRDSSVPDLVSPIGQSLSLTELQQEEERIRHEEEAEVEMKRQAAAKLAIERGLHAGESTEEPILEPKVLPAMENIPPPKASENCNNENSTARSTAIEDATVNMDGTLETRERSRSRASEGRYEDSFVPARLPNFD